MGQPCFYVIGKCCQLFLFAYGLEIVIVKNKEYHRFLKDIVKVHKNGLLKCGFNGIVIVKNRNILELSILF